MASRHGKGLHKANANSVQGILGNRHPQPVAFLAFHQPCHFPKNIRLKYLQIFVLFDLPFLTILL
jgi:hypothetical protein